MIQWLLLVPIERFGNRHLPSIVVAGGDGTLLMWLIGYFDWKRNCPAVSMILSSHEIVRWLERSSDAPLKHLLTTPTVGSDGRLSIACFHAISSSSSQAKYYFTNSSSDCRE